MKLFFEQVFLKISSVFTEQSQICVKNADPALLEQGDLFWWDTLTIVCANKFVDENTSQQNRVIKFCTGRTVLHDKHTDEFLQFAEPVTCREYILPRDEKSSDPQGWIRGITKI